MPDSSRCLTNERDLTPEDNHPTIAPFPIVGVGASAGGLDAFSQLLAALPIDTGMAFVLIQHLEPTHRSHLTELLSRVTAMSITEVVDGVRIEPDHVYVIPPNTGLRLGERVLHLTARPASSSPHLTIDAFFQSLAANQGRFSIAVVLSGTGSDGSEGVKAIKSACGITFAQDEESAQHPAMPRNAVATGAVDYVSSPAQIAAELARISRHRFISTSSDQSHDEILPEGDGELNQIFSLLRRATEVDFSNYKETTLRRRLGRRMLVHHSEDLREYLAYVQQHPDELDKLYKDLLINVTSFFRDPDAFAALADQISANVDKGEIKNSFRAWIPGCSTGEEVYSLAISVDEALEEKGLRLGMQFFGTDISEPALQMARSGVYTQHGLENVSAQRLSRYFRKVDGKYQISKVIREGCIFARQDVTHDTPFSHLDLISCRNMLIYLEPVIQKGLMPIFHYSLNPAALLFLGGAETIGSATDLFSAVDGKHKIFARKPGPSRLAQAFAKQDNSAEPLARVQVETSLTTLELRKQVDRMIQNRYSPDCVVINQDMSILQFRGATGFYLELPAGEATYHLLRMVRGSLQYALRETISRAVQQNLFAEQKGIRIEHMGAARVIDLEVIPVGSGSHSERFYLVVFKQPVPSLQPVSLESTQIDPKDDRANHLEVELAEARQYLRTVSEDYEAALEEARVANEELQSANEELQSSNEELGTIKEELQSANEELTTVNEELDTRNHQLAVLNDDLTNLFGAVNVPIFRVDRKLLLCRFTPAAEKSFGVVPADLGHPIRHLQNRLATHIDIDSVIRDSIENLAVQTHEIEDTHRRWWSLSIRPYRTAEDRLDGAVLTFMDVDSIKHALKASQEAQYYADAIVETVREPIVILGQELRIERANASFYGKFHLDPEQTQGRFLYELGEPRWTIPGLRSLLEEISAQNSSFSDFEVKNTFPNIGPRILLAFEDITDRRQAEESITHQLENTDRELDRTKEELRGLTARLMTAHEDEQRRIAGELHDDLVQRLGFLEFQVEQFRMGSVGKAHADVAGILGSLQGQIAELSEVARNISHGLHPSILDDLGLVAALRKLAQDFSRGRSSPVRFTSRVGRCSLPKRHFAAGIYRIAQESLHNAVKYAPASELTISLRCKQNELQMTIEDSGPGFDPASVRGDGGLGIVNMQERARLLGATIRIDSQPRKGTTITLRAPLTEGVKT
jgi:two-component system CheB/CheR fusion protein